MAKGSLLVMLDKAMKCLLRVGNLIIAPHGKGHISTINKQGPFGGTMLVLYWYRQIGTILILSHGGIMLVLCWY